MRLVGQWAEIEAGLPAGWEQARLRLSEGGPRAAALLGALAPSRTGDALVFTVVRLGGANRPEAVRRALARLDAAGIAGRLQLVDSVEAPVRALEAGDRLAASWTAALAALPEDWSDVYGEVEVTSSDFLDRGALLMAPMNPLRAPGTQGFRFRCARRFGYGTAPEMVERCLARLDEAGITGSVRVVHALSDSRPVNTQGPVWYVGGRTV